MRNDGLKTRTDRPTEASDCEPYLLIPKNIDARPRDGQVRRRSGRSNGDGMTGFVCRVAYRGGGPAL
jgi:hypothetical protein